MKILYTAHATSKGGRAGHVDTDDKTLAFDLVKPADTSGKKGTNPEQLFACGYAACFGGALEYVASLEKVHTVGTTVTADVSLIQEDKGGFIIGVQLNILMPNVNRATAEKLVNQAHQVCPYSKATRGNVEVKLNVLNG